MALTRRKFALGIGAATSGAMIDAQFGTSDPAPFTGLLPIPNLIDAAKQGNAVNLRAMSGRHAFIKGKPTRTYGYSAPILGPVIRLRRGDEVAMSVENALDTVTTVHWHGLLVPGHNDGGPQQLIKPGYTWRPVLKIDQPAATLWFHPHPHHDTARQAEASDGIYMLEAKAKNEMADPVVIAKRDVAVKWCHQASQYATSHGGKPWTYALIPHDVIAENMTLPRLAADFGVAGP